MGVELARQAPRAQLLRTLTVLSLAGRSKRTEHAIPTIGKSLYGDGREGAGALGARPHMVLKREEVWAIDDARLGTAAHSIFLAIGMVVCTSGLATGAGHELHLLLLSSALNMIPALHTPILARTGLNRRE
ncbi:hypothetical protein B0H13DRAFT_2385845 [Mycena leptocephala]|nr:hypothetical protein B0H13DRAFT_2385845 [Mycena leptocephala]